MKHYEISSGVPLPETAIERAMEALQVGESFAFPSIELRRHTVQIMEYRLAPKRFAIRRLNSEEARVWRIE